jgi:hypothetical protein
MIVRAHLKRHNKPSPLDKQHSGGTLVHICAKDGQKVAL